MILFNPTVVYLTVQGVLSLLQSMMFLVTSIYYVQVVGMNPLQLVLVGTTIEVSILLFEVPTGVVADTFSRKISVVIGQIIIGACFVLEGFVPVFLAIIVAEFLRGIGETFISGAFSAWLADEIGESKVGRVFLRAGQIGRATSIIGIILGVVFGLAGLYIPIVIGGFSMIGVGLFMAFAMKEVHFTPTPRGERTTWQAMSHTTREGLRVARGRPMALTILLVGFLYGAFSEGFDRLWEAHLLKDFTLPFFEPVIWFGIISIISILLGIVVLEVIIRRIDTGNSLSLVRAAMVCDSLLVIGLLVFALSGNVYLALCGLFLAQNMRGTGIYETWINQNLESKVRATVLSLSSQLNALGQFSCGPLVGLIGTVVSIPAALATSALVLSPTILLYARTLRRSKIVANL